MLQVYADNAATTRMSPEVLAAMTPFFQGEYGNASSLYRLGQTARKAVETAREQAAALLGCDRNEIFFTGCGTESDNWALKGAARARKAKGRHIISTKIEHPAVLQSLKALEREGFEITLLEVDRQGKISLDGLLAAIRPETILLSIMTANNEVGTIQPISEIGRIAREKNICFHTDAVQAGGHIPLDVDTFGVDLLTLSAHKIYGPKGVGLLYIRKGTKIENLIDGGGHERGRRSGTENVPGIVGFGQALEEARGDLEQEMARVTALRDRLVEGVLRIPDTALTGHPTDRLPGSASFTVKYIEGESMILMLDMDGIAASSGSACSSGSLDPSHVLLACGLNHEEAHGSLRLTLGRYSTEEDVDYILEKFPPIVERLRAMSPVMPR